MGKLIDREGRIYEKSSSLSSISSLILSLCHLHFCLIPGSLGYFLSGVCLAMSVGVSLA